MNTPEFHDGLPQDPASAEYEAVRRVDEISRWFREYQVVAPRLRILRVRAVLFLRETKSIPEIARLCDIQESRVREILKDSREVLKLDRKAAAMREAGLFSDEEAV